MNIPAIRGIIGNTVFYSAVLTMGEIADIVKPIDKELHNAVALRDQIQRSLTASYKKITEYILSHDDRFFNALVLAVYDGDPLWTEIRYKLEKEEFSNVGILSFNGDEKIFPVDGQHRVAGIKDAIKENPQLKEEKICAMFIGHSNTPEGMEKSRRIFSTLNRYAKPVRLGDIIALDEDDIVAIATRIQLENNPLFQGNRVKASNGRSISSTDKKSFTSLISLYDCHIELFKCFFKSTKEKILSSSSIKEYLRNRPLDKEIDEFNNFLTNFWNDFSDVFPEISEYINDKTANPAEKYRPSDNGGNIFFRPVALSPFIAAVASISIKKDIHDLKDILISYSNIKRIVSENPWNRIIWDPIKKQMITQVGKTVYYMMICMYDKSLLSDRELSKLRSTIQLKLGLEDDSTLARFIKDLELSD